MTWDELDWEILDRLRDGFLHPTAGRGPYWQSSADLAHYDFTYAERIGWKWDAVLSELTRRGWSPPPGHMLDWGCGSGIAGRRVLQRWPTAAAEASLQVFDHSLLAEQFAAEQAQAAVPGLAVSSWDRAVPIATLVVSHVLNELDDESATELEHVLTRAQCVLWVEPGDRASAAALVGWREKLRDTFRVAHPCPHQSACGLLAPGNERHWCHHFASPPAGIFTDSHWVKFGQRAGIDLRSLPYATLVMERPDRPEPHPLPPDAGRVIGRPEIFKPYARLLGCDASGVTPLELPKRQAPALVKKLDRPGAPRLFRWSHAGGRINHAKPIAPPPS